MSGMVVFRVVESRGQTCSAGGHVNRVVESWGAGLLKPYWLGCPAGQGPQL